MSYGKLQVLKIENIKTDILEFKIDTAVLATYKTYSTFLIRRPAFSRDDVRIVMHFAPSSRNLSNLVKMLSDHTQHKQFVVRFDSSTTCIQRVFI